MKSPIIYITDNGKGGNQNGLKFTVSTFNESRFKTALEQLPYAGTVIYNEDATKEKVTFIISSYKITKEQVAGLAEIG